MKKCPKCGKHIFLVEHVDHMSIYPIDPKTGSHSPEAIVQQEFLREVYTMCEECNQEEMEENGNPIKH